MREIRLHVRMHFSWRLFVACVLAAGSSAPARSLDFSNDVILYEESFDGEISFPITPEVDTISAGGLVGFSLVGNFGLSGPPPVLDGASVVEIVSRGFDELFASGVIFTTNSIGTGSYNLRGEFKGLSASDTGLAWVQLASNVDSGEINVGAISMILNAEIDGMGAVILSIKVTERDGSTPASFNNSMQITLSAAETVALLGGAEFTLDCQVDRAGETATGSIEVSGFAEVTVGPMPLMFISPSDPMVGAGQQLVEVVQGFPGTFVEVELGNFRISRASATSVPVLYPPALILLAVVLLSSGAWRSRSGRAEENVGRSMPETVHPFR